MTKSKIKTEAQNIFNNLTDAQKNHIYNIYKDQQYSERNKNLKDCADRLFTQRETITEFLTVGHSVDVHMAFNDILYDYLYNRYKTTDKQLDDLLCEDPQ